MMWWKKERGNKNGNIYKDDIYVDEGHRCVQEFQT